jgi:23S rRNA (cytosine1962-C5)-methyltransferase
LLQLIASGWQDYELVDSGGGRKLERFGPYLLIRPDAQADWQPATPAAWPQAHAEYVMASAGREGTWHYRQPLPARWPLAYRSLRFWVQARQSRQVGVFPENAVHWDWLIQQAQDRKPPVHVLNLFGYTGLATLAAAGTGARVTHVDASRKSVSWARENQVLSGLADRPIRWIVEDALKYVGREERRGVRYDGLIMDPPAFGRGPGGEVWALEALFPALCQACQPVLSAAPRYVIVTAYTKSVVPALLATAVEQMMAGHVGELVQGELVTMEKSAGRMLRNATFVRWQAGQV